MPFFQSGLHGGRSVREVLGIGIFISSRNNTNFRDRSRKSFRINVMGTSSLDLKRRLREVAERQGGYFTASQAIHIGYNDSTHGYHVRNGDWARAGWGIYRLNSIAITPWSELHRILLWSRSKNGDPQGVFCGDTAIAIKLESVSLLDLDRVELCLPKDFRRSAPFPENIKPIFEDVCKEGIDVVRGLPITSQRIMGNTSGIYINPKIIGFDSQGYARDFIDMGED